MCVAGRTEERVNPPFGSACNLVRNISMGLMTVALRVRAKEPATNGAGVRLAVMVFPVISAFRLSEEALAAGSFVPVKYGETTVRRYS
jgi:hypothetical protein